MKNNNNRLNVLLKNQLQHNIWSWWNRHWGINFNIIYNETCMNVLLKSQLHNSINVLLKNQLQIIVQELCESRGGRPGLSVLTSLLASVDVKIYCTVLRHWSQLVPNMSTDIWGHWASTHHHQLQNNTWWNLHKCVTKEKPTLSKVIGYLWLNRKKWREDTRR